ncbi:hypothetical protein GZ203_07715 [Dermatophilus congolensis]|uniref:hypothetical protein n=1 Tax=Dermatophilus congolensis TaxID=1863 RepID=UPI001AB0596D|nr:hypothetical protein [Dermatophilus congolensis]MBO3186166.1 hypothetical protein [Dermatophilus congolensis]
MTPHAHPAVEAGCWILSIVTSLMASQTSGEITWLLLGFVAPGAYWLAVARPMRDKSPELELQNAVYFNNAARLTLVSFFMLLYSLVPAGRRRLGLHARVLLVAMARRLRHGMPESPEGARVWRWNLA